MSCHSVRCYCVQGLRRAVTTTAPTKLCCDTPTEPKVTLFAEINNGLGTVGSRSVMLPRFPSAALRSTAQLSGGNLTFDNISWTAALEHCSGVREYEVCNSHVTAT